MRACTSSALCVLLVAAAVGCGSDEGAAPIPPGFTGELPGSSSTDDGSHADGVDSNTNTSPLQPDNTSDQSNNNPANGEGIDNDIELTPSEPSGDATSGDATNNDNGEPSTEPDPVEEPDAIDPDPPEQPDPVEEPPVVEAQTQVFILFGQSNMWGVAIPETQDMVTNDRVEVLTLTACGNHGANQWVTARPPLHSCVGQPGGGQGPGVGPGDYFARTVAEAFPNDTILLVPNADPGVSIDVFQPGQQRYNNMVSRARMAQERGEIRGILFHQGESDANQQSWPGRVQNVVQQLKSDLGIGDVPFLAGELMPTNGGLAQHNQLIAQLTNVINNAHVVSSQGFSDIPAALDNFGNLHFDLRSQREFGRRYADVYLNAIGQ